MHSLGIKPMTLALPELVFCGCKKFISNWNTVSLAKTKQNKKIHAANVFILNLYLMHFSLSRTKRICRLSKLLFVRGLCGVSLMTMIVSHYKLLWAKDSTYRDGPKGSIRTQALNFNHHVQDWVYKVLNFCKSSWRNCANRDTSKKTTMKMLYSFKYLSCGLFVCMVSEW